MTLINPFVPADCAPVHWREIKHTTDRLFASAMPATLRQLELFINPDDIDAHRARMEDEFHITSAATLGMARSPYEQAAASGRIQWCRADTAQLHPPCQIRIDGGPWHNLTEFMRP